MLIGVVLDEPDRTVRAFAGDALLFLLPVIAATLIGGLPAALVAVAASFGVILVEHIAAMGGRLTTTSDDLVAVGIYLIVALTLSHSINRERTGRAQLAVAQERLAFIARASELLASTSLDMRRALSELGKLAVPHLADLCVVTVVEEDGTINPVVVAHDDPVDPARAENILVQTPPLAGAAGVGAVVRTRRSEMYPRVDDEILARVAWNPVHLNLLRGLKIRSMMIVPVQSLTHVFGTMTLAITSTRARYTDAELALAEDVAARAGTVLENVRLYEERSREARTLQETLLPAEIPPIPWADVVVRFRPQGNTALVGGDFYDVFQITPTAWGVVVGDVCGKGIEAAALTGLVRHTIRIAALGEHEPRRVLEVLNDALLLEASDRYCTAVFARLEQTEEGTRVTLAVGGHPPPIIVSPGEAKLVGTRGTLLGAFPDPDIGQDTIHLRPKEGILLYTDGVLDERLDDPERVLCDLVARMPDRAPDGIVDRVEQAAARRDPPPDDDIALVYVGVTHARVVRLNGDAPVVLREEGLDIHP